MEDTLSAYMQVYQNKRAVFEALKSFRTFYPFAPITVLSDNGDDFADIAKAFNTRYVYSQKRMTTGPADQRTNAPSTLDGIREYFSRLYDHCNSNQAEWVLLLETDVRTIRRVRTFPHTDCAGPRLNPFSPELTDYLTDTFGIGNYGYGMSGGSIFRRRAFIEAYERNHDLTGLARYDNGVANYGDLSVTLLFIINGFTYSVWEDVSEIFHERVPIIRDAAFDHAYKYWYDKDFQVELLEECKQYPAIPETAYPEA